ncbi:MAG: type I-C CRISPR-associated endonuclease Cas1c [Dehalococcoidia bacterium]
MTQAILQNTLYILTDGAFLRRDHETLEVMVERECRLRVPIRNVEAVVAFGRTMVSPEAMRLCTEFGAALTFLSNSGRLLARVDAPGSGNVLLRRQQFRLADDASASREIARCIVLGKLVNERALLLRNARDAPLAQAEALRRAAERVGLQLSGATAAGTMDALRGHEGVGARAYFSGLPFALRQQQEAFLFSGRNRRPPRDPCNALLSFLYALALSDCVAGLTSAGLDPSVGYLHDDRPGRPSLALDLLEEFRSLIADRLALALINRRQITPSDFEAREGGAVSLTEDGRRRVVTEYQRRKQEEVTHPFLNQSTRLGQVFSLQARLLARRIRGDLAVYPPFVLR